MSLLNIEMLFLCFLQLDRMESKLNDKVSKLQGCQEKRLQLEENIQRLQPQIRDMKNTQEKYTNSMTVQPNPLSIWIYIVCFFAHQFCSICDFK